MESSHGDHVPDNHVPGVPGDDDDDRQPPMMMMLMMCATDNRARQSNRHRVELRLTRYRAGFT
jgi:hypothetical protein